MRVFKNMNVADERHFNGNGLTAVVGGKHGFSLYEFPIDILDCSKPHQLKYYITPCMAILIKEFLEDPDQEKYNESNMSRKEIPITKLAQYTYIKLKAPFQNRTLRTDEKTLKEYISTLDI